MFHFRFHFRQKNSISVSVSQISIFVSIFSFRFRFFAEKSESFRSTFIPSYRVPYTLNYSHRGPKQISICMVAYCIDCTRYPSLALSGTDIYFAHTLWRSPSGLFSFVLPCDCRWWSMKLQSDLQIIQVALDKPQNCERALENVLMNSFPSHRRPHWLTRTKWLILHPFHKTCR
jgi:hypothetical protein